MKMSLIFVQIASYRDPELSKTIKSLIENADNPDNLRICICFQYDEDDDFNDDINEYYSDKRFNIIRVPCKDSKGACWARNLIQQQYNNEEYTLQLDSHHRFVKGWDTICIDMYNTLYNNGVSKPLLTTYLPSYNPQTDHKENKPWKMVFDRFTPEGVIFFLPSVIDNYENIDYPVKSRFYSAHFCFTSGLFCKEVQHNPNYYFHGEEISIAVRAYTHGYDLYHPHKMIAWHEYTRESRTKHWDDHEWFEQNNQSLKLNRQLFGMDGEEQIDFNEYGFGKVRTLNDYEEYAGIKFNTREVRQSCINGVEPNELLTDNFIKYYKHCIDIHKSQLENLENYKFIAVILQDEDGNELYRHDVLEDELYTMSMNFKHQDFYNFWVQFTLPDHIHQPYNYVIWPYKNDWIAEPLYSPILLY